MTRSDTISRANRARRAGTDSATRGRWAEASDYYTEAGALYEQGDAADLATEARQEADQCRRNARNLIMFPPVRPRLVAVEGQRV